MKHNGKFIIALGSGVLWAIIAVGLGVGIFLSGRNRVVFEFSSRGSRFFAECFYSEHSGGRFSEKDSVRSSIAIKHAIENLVFQFPLGVGTIQALRFDWDKPAAILLKSITLHQGNRIFRLSGSGLAEAIGDNLQNAHKEVWADGWISLRADGPDPGFFLTGEWRKYAETTTETPWEMWKTTPLTWEIFGALVIWEGLLFVLWVFFLALLEFSTAENWRKAVSGLKNGRGFWIAAACFVLASIGLFSIYLCRNYALRYYDEWGYANTAIQLLQREAWGKVANLRTYLYPGWLALGTLLVGEVRLKPFISILQYLFLLGSCACILKCIHQTERGKRPGWLLALTGGTLICNPYLIQAATLLTTDLTAACLIGVAFYAFLFRPWSVRNSIAAPVMIVLAGMIRPAMFYFLFAFLICYVVKFFREAETHSPYTFLKPVPAALLLCFLCCVPQFIWLKQLSPDEFRFPIVANLGSSQMVWGMQSLKYGTYVGSERGPQVFFRNPFFDDSIKSSGEFFQRKPLSAAATCLCHILSMIDHGEIDTYMRSLDSWSRKVSSFFNYLFWYIILLGLLLQIRLRRRKIVPGATLLQLGVPILIYFACCSMTLVEARFLYPVLLLLPCFFYGGCRLLQEYLREPRGRLRRVVATVAGAVIFEFSFYAYSYWLDSFIS